MLSCVEHEKSFITSGPGCMALCVAKMAEGEFLLMIYSTSV